MKFKDFFPKKFYPPNIPDQIPEKTRKKRKVYPKEVTAEMFNPIEVPKKIENNGPKHWKLAATTVVNPHPMNVPEDPAVTRLSFTGKTTYLFVCEETGEFRKEEVEGVEPTDLDMLVQKVESSGPEYVVRQTGTYILMKKPQDALPVR